MSLFVMSSWLLFNHSKTRNSLQTEWHCTISQGNKVAPPLPWTTIPLRSTLAS